MKSIIFKSILYAIWIRKKMINLLGLEYFCFHCICFKICIFIVCAGFFIKNIHKSSLESNLILPGYVLVLHIGINIFSIFLDNDFFGDVKQFLPSILSNVNGIA